MTEQPIYTVENLYPGTQLIKGERLLVDGEEPRIGLKWYVGEQSKWYITAAEVEAHPHLFKKHS